MKAPSLTLGIEEEYQIIDPATGELKSYITQILDEGKVTLKEQIKAELHQSMVEVGTEVCNTPAEARAELVKLRSARRSWTSPASTAQLAVIAAAGTHPFSSVAARRRSRRSSATSASKTTWATSPSNC